MSGNYPKNFASPGMLPKAQEYHNKDVKNYGKPTLPKNVYKVKKSFDKGYKNA